jgi:hypothetical protein
MCYLKFFSYELNDILCPNEVFVGIISDKPSRDFTRPLGSPKGLKGLWHMLNAIISSTKEDLFF